MNNKGQTLVIFIILIPLLLLIGALIIDNSMMVYKKIKLKNTTKDIIKVGLEKNNLTDDEIKKLYYKNDIDVEHLLIKRTNNSLNIDVTYYIESILGKLINLNNYKISVNITGIKNDNKIIFD